MNNRTKQKIRIFFLILVYAYYLSVNQPVRFYMLKNLTSDSTVSLDTMCDRIIDSRPQTAGDIFKILYDSDDRLTNRLDNLASWARMFE